MRFTTAWKARFRTMSEMNLQTNEVINEEGMLFALGLAAKARALVFGTLQICEELAKNKKGAKYPLLVIEASDTSDNTHKRICDRCRYYNVKHIRIAATTAALAHALGKSALVSAVAITDENLCRLAEKHIR